MADDSSGSAPIVQANGFVDFSLRSNRLEEIEELTNRFIIGSKLHLPSRCRTADCTLSIHSQRDLEIFTVGYWTELAIQLDPTDNQERLAFVVADRGAGQVRIGGQEYAYTAGQAAIFSSGLEAFLRYGSDCETLTILISRHKIAEQCAKFLGHEVERSIDFDNQVSLENGVGQSWVRLMRYVAGEWGNPFSMTRQVPAVAQQLEQTVLTSLVLGHTHTYSEALLRPQSAAAPFYVRRAEAFIEAHFAEALSLADIAAHAGVSARSLQNGFQSFRGMTPMGFLRLVRLKRAQEALLRADPAVATVTEIALGCGFGHLGEFASLYRRTFGETPKQTLAKVVYR